ncbi:MAG: substrate-binding domain-containing protein [Caldilineaceae bacterium]
MIRWRLLGRLLGRLGWLGYILLLLILSACQPVAVTGTRPITFHIAGATSMQPVLLALTSEFSQLHPQVFFVVGGGGSTIGEQQLYTDQVELAASTLISPTVPSVLVQRQSKVPLMRVPIGIDGLAIVVNAANPLENLSLNQLQLLYSGQIWEWAELNGQTEEVILVSREDGSGSRRLFEERVMGDDKVALTAVVMPTSADVVDYVAKHAGAIGYVSRAFVATQIESPPAAASSPRPQSFTQGPTSNAPTVRVVALEGQLPTLAALQTQSYSLIQPLYLTTHGKPSGWLQRFIDFCVSPAGQAIVARYHARLR